MQTKLSGKRTNLGLLNKESSEDSGSGAGSTSGSTVSSGDGLLSLGKSGVLSGSEGGDLKVNTEMVGLGNVKSVKNKGKKKTNTRESGSAITYGKERENESKTAKNNNNIKTRKKRTTLGGGSDLLQVVNDQLSSRGLDDSVPGGLGVVRLSGSEGNSLGHFSIVGTNEDKATW